MVWEPRAYYPAPTPSFFVRAIIRKTFRVVLIEQASLSRGLASAGVLTSASAECLRNVLCRHHGTFGSYPSWLFIVTADLHFGLQHSFLLPRVLSSGMTLYARLPNHAVHAVGSRHDEEIGFAGVTLANEELLPLSSFCSDNLHRTVRYRSLLFPASFSARVRIGREQLWQEQRGL